MRLIFILDNFYPNGRASAARVRQYSKGCVENGINMVVVLPKARLRFGQERLNPQRVGHDQYGNKYIQMAGTCMRSRYFPLRVLQDLWGMLHTIFWLLTHLSKSDKIVLYIGGNKWYNLMLKVCKLRHAEVGLELNELPYGTGQELGRSLSQINKLRNVQFSKLFPKFDFFFCISEELKKLATQYSPSAKIIKVPIMCEGASFQEKNIDNNVPFIFHSGSLTEQKDGICGMLEAFGIACKSLKKRVEFILTGKLSSSPHCKQIEKILDTYSIRDRVKFVGHLNNDELCSYQKNCCLVIINKYNTEQNKYCFSTKLSEYLYFSRPVITTRVGEALNYLKNNINAYLVTPGDVNELANKIIYAMEHLDISKKIGEEGHLLTKDVFSTQNNVQKIIKTLS